MPVWSLWPPSPPTLTTSYSPYSGIKLRNASNTDTKPFPLHASFFSSPVTIISTTLSPFSLLDPLSSSLVTGLQAPSQSHLKITNCSFRHAAPQLWNKLPHSPHAPVHVIHCSPCHSCSNLRPVVNLSHDIFQFPLKPTRYRAVLSLSNGFRAQDPQDPGGPNSRSAFFLLGWHCRIYDFSFAKYHGAREVVTSIWGGNWTIRTTDYSYHRWIIFTSLSVSAHCHWQILLKVPVTFSVMILLD